MDEQTPKNGRKKTLPICPPGICGAGGSCGGAYGCGCGGDGWRCQRSCPGTFFVVRWLLGLAIIVLIFWCGMKIGELKAELRADGFSGRGVYNRFQTLDSADRVMMFDRSVPAVRESVSLPTKTEPATGN